MADKPKTRSRVVVKGNPLQKEAKASTVIKPGHLVTWAANGASLILNNQAAGLANLGGERVAVAVENIMNGKTVDDAYGATERVTYVVPRSGDEIMIRLKASAGAIVAGQALKADATGAVVKSTAVADTIGFAMESKTDLASEQFIIMEVK